MKVDKPALALIIGFLISCSGSKTETTVQTITNDSVGTTAFLTEQPNSINAEPEQVDTATFRRLINLFEQTGAEMPEWALEFIGAGVSEMEHFTTQQVLDTEPFYVLAFSKFSPVGPGVETMYAVSLAQNGTLASTLELGKSYPSSGPGGGGEDCTYTYDADMNVIFVSRSSTDWDEEKQDEFTIQSMNPYYVDKEGAIVYGRKYPQVSETNLDPLNLTQLSKEELKIMRNEIFAVYGYVFKTEPLKSYYASKPWYKPERDNVDDYLSEIEKANVALIKKVESQK